MPEWVGDTIFAKKFREGPQKDQPAVVTAQTGPVSYKVKESEIVWKHHVDQLRRYTDSDEAREDVREENTILPDSEQLEYQLHNLNH